ncbi:helix-turn-helix domain-containing protein [Roseateles sp.]|uniref:helix-turn-helix domain-containing protein n=1 Tax=Roseateles sp. TaxID=1971397 RepID=UPI0039E9DA6E
MLKHYSTVLLNAIRYLENKISSTKMLKVIQGIGARLRGERERLGLSQKRLGEACDVSLMTQHRFETDQNALNTSYLQAAQEVGVDIGVVLAGASAVSVSGDDWKLIRSCVRDVGQYCALHWADCPDDYKWALVERLYRQRREHLAPAGAAAIANSKNEIETLLGVRP